MLPSRNRCLLVFVALCCFRLCNIALIQSYFDPDEFWQTLEPAYCAVLYPTDHEEESSTPLSSRKTKPLTPCSGLTWEWTRRRRRVPTATQIVPSQTSTAHNRWVLPSLVWQWIEDCMWGPARTYLSVLPTILFYHVLLFMKRHHPHGTVGWWIVARGPMLVNAVTVAAPIDFLVWVTAHYLVVSGARSNTAAPPNHTRPSSFSLPAWCLFCSASSWFHGYALVRSFANCQETLGLILAVALVGPELLLPHPQPTTRSTSKKKTPSPTTTERVVAAAAAMPRACLAFFVGGCSVAVRSTAAAAFVPMGILLAYQYAVQSQHQQQPPLWSWMSRLQSLLLFCQYLVSPCAMFGLLGLLAAMMVDRFFFGFWTIPFLGNSHFNVVLNYANLYGAHPWHWYLTAGIPALSGLLLPFVMHNLMKLLSSRTRNNPSIETTYSYSSVGHSNLWIIVATYIFAVSMNSHKEFRYILPILPLLCLLVAAHVRDCFDYCAGNRRTRFILLGALWILANLIAVLYLGLFHQSGPISVNREIVRRVTAAAAVGNNAMAQTTKPMSIHYLTGACHSTPLHSHLHIENRAPFSVWHLDCSPQCRAASRNATEPLCEYSRFAANPLQFVQQAYCVGLTTRRERWQCQASHSTPDFIVTFSDYVSPAVSELLEKHLSLQLVACFPNNINGIQFGMDEQNTTTTTTGNLASTSPSCGLPIVIGSGMVQVNTNDVVLYARK